MVSDTSASSWSHELQALASLCIGGSAFDAEGLNWSRLAALARHERCLGLAWSASAHRIKASAPSDVIAHWHHAVRVNAARAAARLELAGLISARARERSISVGVLKGTPLSQRLFGHWAIRPAGDIDFFTDARDRTAFDALLLECGLMRLEITALGEGRYRREIGADRQSVEVHSNLFDESTMVSLELGVRSLVPVEIGGFALAIPDAVSELTFLAMKLSSDGTLRLLHAFDFSRAWEIASSADRAEAARLARSLRLQNHVEWCLTFCTALLDAANGDRKALAFLEAERGALQVTRMLRLADGPVAKWSCLLGWIYPWNVRHHPRATIDLVGERALKLVRLLGLRRNWRNTASARRLR